jgi:hypothetical protein
MKKMHFEETFYAFFPEKYTLIATGYDQRRRRFFITKSKYRYPGTCLMQTHFFAKKRVTFLPNAF